MIQPKRTVHCAIYTRKSHEEGLEQEFNSLDAQRQSAEAYIESQRHEGWQLIRKRYDDAAYSGGTLDRPALTELLADIQAGHVDCVVVYKVDRLSRSLLDFAKLISLFDEHQVSFVSVTQQFNTTTSMGRLTLNILLSFAQFEREIIGERIRDKKQATARQGKYIGGGPILGLDVVDKKYVVNREEAKHVRDIFNRFEKLESCRKVAIENQQQDRYPGLSVRRDGDAVVVHIPMRLRRRNGRCMVMAEGEAEPVSAAKHVEETSGANRILIEAIAKGHRWQAQLESGEYAGLEDLAHAVGCDRTYVGRMLRLTSLAPDIIEAILRGDEPDGLSLEKLRKNLPVQWDEQRTSLTWTPSITGPPRRDVPLKTGRIGGSGAYRE